jgi:tRNA-splicing ligase RtcB
MNVSDLVGISAHEWEIPAEYRQGMLMPVRVFATAQELDHILADKSLEQAVNAAMLPGLAAPVVVMPDVHQGYGFPIGGVAAIRWPEGVISPGAIGYDINCGVRLLASELEAGNARPRLAALADRLNSYCPSGVGKAGGLRLSTKAIDRVLWQGAEWALERGLATKSDLEFSEEGGRFHEADPKSVSQRAKERGRHQLGSLGAGNHFIEVDEVQQVFEEDTAAAMGLHPGCVAVQIHCGSRGLGHQVCTDYVADFQLATRKYGIALPDRELACAPMDALEGRAYLAAMRAAGNFAFANRQVLAEGARRAFQETFSDQALSAHLRQVYDVTHNMGKIERLDIGGQTTPVCTHRKGATRAFGPGATELPELYRLWGQPVLVPGSMGSASWVLVATSESLRKSLGSCCHGAGRLWSRAEAKRRVRGETLRQQMEAAGIAVRAGSLRGLAEEAPRAYKDVDTVVETVVAIGIARKVARLKPLAVIKG